MVSEMGIKLGILFIFLHYVPPDCLCLHLLTYWYILVYLQLCV